MTASLSSLIAIGIPVAAIVIAILCYKILLRIFGVIFIPKNAIGIVNKKFALFGANRTLPDGEIIALKGEAGIQADTLPPGVHFWFWPWQFSIQLQQFISIEQGHIGVVEARGGKPLANGRILAKTVKCDSFQNVRMFLEGGGERGPQIAIIPPGTYRINTAFFEVSAALTTQISDNAIGIVTTQDGKPLPTGEIAGKEVPEHNTFQDGESFIEHGGYKGLQEQVLVAGQYYINPRFATIEIKPMTEVPIAHVGVVIAYVGATGIDTTGDGFKHGNLVSKGQKGVWVEVLDPGKYPINPYTHNVVSVPTANVVLNWADGKSEAHKLDANLCTIKVRSSDGFTFNLDVSQIIHIPRNDAPRVIARFGSVENLVSQVLEPTIGNYFRNAAQNSDVIDFLKKRQERQKEAKTAISSALQEYNVGAVDTLIGDIVPPESLMKTLTDRKLAEQEKVTFETQRLAQETRKDLQQATAMAETQATVVNAERSVSIADFQAQAAIKQAGGLAEAKKVQAAADAMVVKTVGEAEAAKTKAVGTAEADVIQLKIRSMEAGNYAAVQVAQSLSNSRVPIVPSITVGSGSRDGQGGGTIVDVLLANMLLKQTADRATGPGMDTDTTPAAPQK
ncbi:MAG: hypothetical protein KGI69_01615 [Patescibacteria group bacterium]|nr:hypothetical protein [Patescibacteria group bacterium]